MEQKQTRKSNKFLISTEWGISLLRYCKVFKIGFFFLIEFIYFFSEQNKNLNDSSNKIAHIRKWKIKTFRFIIFLPPPLFYFFFQQEEINGDADKKGRIFFFGYEIKTILVEKAWFFFHILQKKWCVYVSKVRIKFDSTLNANMKLE